MAQVAQGMIDLDDIDMVYYDPADGQLKFVGNHSGRLPPLVFDDLVECLEILGQGHNIGVSIEPDSPNSESARRPQWAAALRMQNRRCHESGHADALYTSFQRMSSPGWSNIVGMPLPKRDDSIWTRAGIGADDSTRQSASPEPACSVSAKAGPLD